MWQEMANSFWASHSVIPFLENDFYSNPKKDWLMHPLWPQFYDREPPLGSRYVCVWEEVDREYLSTGGRGRMEKIKRGHYNSSNSIDFIQYLFFDFCAMTDATDDFAFWKTSSVVSITASPLISSLQSDFNMTSLPLLAPHS